MGRVRAVLFDAVGTLFFSCRPVAEVYAAAGRERGLDLTAATVRERFVAAFERHFGRLTPQSPSEQTVTSEALERQRWRAVVREVFDPLPGGHEELFAQLWEHFARGPSWQLYSDVEEIWRELCHLPDLQLGIASNYDGRLLTVLRDLPPLNDCRWVFHSAGIGFAKPGRRFFQEIERRLGLGPEELLFVGDDRVNDYEGARQAGWQALWLVRAAEGDVEWPRIRSLSEVRDWLRQHGEADGDGAGRG